MIICELSKARDLYRTASAASRAATVPPLRMTADMGEKLFFDMLALKQAAHKKLIIALQSATLEETTEHMDILMFGSVQ